MLDYFASDFDPIYKTKFIFIIYKWYCEDEIKTLLALERLLQVIDSGDEITNLFDVLSLVMNKLKDEELVDSNVNDQYVKIRKVIFCIYFYI